MKSKLIYKLITILTLALPLPIYLIVSAVIFNIQADYIIHNAEIDDLSVFSKNDEYFITTDNKDVSFSGTMVYDNDLDTYVMVIETKDIIKVGKGYYSYDVENGLVDIRKIEKQQQQSYKIPLSVFISLGAILIVVLIIQKKMNWHKTYPRIATLIALLFGTIILFILNTVVSSILNVFLVATVSWAMYCLEYTVYSQIEKTKTNEKQEGDIIKALKNAIKE